MVTTLPTFLVQFSCTPAIAFQCVIIEVEFGAVVDALLAMSVLTQLLPVLVEQEAVGLLLFAILQKVILLGQGL